MKKIISVLLSLTMLVSLAGCSGNYIDDNGGITKLSANEANATLSSMLTKVKVTEGNPQVDLDTNEKYIEELPDIDSTYKFTLNGTAECNIEIWTTSEKCGEGNDGWLNKVGESFNNQRNRLSNGKTVSVSIRKVDSVAGLDYIVHGRIPDAWNPSSNLLGNMAESKGIQLNTVTDRLVGNTAGVLMKRSTYDTYTAAHGDVTMRGLVDAVNAQEIVMGLTNAYTSATAMNILAELLTSMNPEAPLSDETEAAFLEFQKNVPPPAYTTAQMRESAKKGFIDVMAMEAQGYSNEPTLSDYVFTPMGVRHDNPVYTFPSVSAERQEALNMFVNYAKNADNQKLASQMGFNQHDEYAGAKAWSGSDLYRAQAMWKKTKSGGKANIAVFVADVSGSMSGQRIFSLRDSLLNSMQYISEDSEIGLVSFSDDVCIELPIDKFEGAHRGKFQSAVKNLTPKNSTHMYSGILVAIDMIQKQKQIEPDANYMIFVLSDGANTGGVSESIVSQLVVSYGIPVHCIGYSADADMGTLKKLASYTEGFSEQVTEENVIYNMRNIFNSQM